MKRKVDIRNVREIKDTLKVVLLLRDVIRDREFKVLTPGEVVREALFEALERRLTLPSNGFLE
jgi:hypothetical protein